MEIVFLHTVDPSALSKRLLMDVVVSAMAARVGAVRERHYRRYERILDEELGLAPSPEMRDLIEVLTV